MAATGRARFAGASRVAWYDRSSNLVAGFLFRQPKPVGLLQIRPQRRPRSEPIPEPQRGVGRHRALAGEALGIAVRRDVQLPPQLRGAHLKFRELVEQDSARMDRW